MQRKPAKVEDSGDGESDKPKLAMHENPKRSVRLSSVAHGLVG